MTKSYVKWAIACLAALVLQGTAASAVDLNGAWASDASVCDKIFQTNKNVISIRRDSDLYGSGFIVDGNQIRGKVAKCTIKSRKEDGQIIHLISACSSDIALSTVQFSLRADNDNQVTRIFPGLPEMSVSYVRCRL
jgi:hypothetical protein